MASDIEKKWNLTQKTYLPHFQIAWQSRSKQGSTLWAPLLCVVSGMMKHFIMLEHREAYLLSSVWQRDLEMKTAMILQSSQAPVELMRFCRINCKYM